MKLRKRIRWQQARTGRKTKLIDVIACKTKLIKANNDLQRSRSKRKGTTEDRKS